MVSAPVRYQQVASIRSRGLSLQHTCALMSVARSTRDDTSRLAKRDVPVLA
jgi:hypothetical protein